MIYRNTKEVKKDEVKVISKGFSVTFENPTIFIGEFFIKIVDFRGCCMFEKKHYDFLIGERVTIINE